MSGGTKESASLGIKTKRQRYGKDFFSKNGKKGGQARNESDKKHLTFKDKEKASNAGAKGAQIRWENYRRKKAGLPPLETETQEVDTSKHE